MPKKGNQPPPWVMGGGDVTDPPEDDPRPTAQARRKREPRKSYNSEYDKGPSEGKKCGANKPDGGTCGLIAGFGTEHPGYGPCKWHLGSTKEGRKAAATEMAEELMVFYGEPVETDPIQALLDEVCRTAGHIAWLGQVIGKFNVPLTETDDKGDLRPAGVPVEVESWIRLYNSERGQLVRVSAAALNAGVNERLVQIAEYQGAKFADAVDAILAGLGLSPAQQAIVPRLVPGILRQLVSAGPITLEGDLEP